MRRRVHRGLYEFSKNNAGLLKPVFQSVEDIFFGIIGPVCDKYHHVPLQLLQFLARKVDELIHKIDWQNASLPTVVKHVLEKAIEVVRELAVEIHQTGLINATANAAKEAYGKYKPVAKDLAYMYEPVVEDYALWAWWGLNRVPIVSHTARRMLSLTAQRGYPLVDYMPMIPIERISQVLTKVANGDVNGTERDTMVLMY